MTNDQTRVLVTGAGGFLGQACLRALRDVDVVATCRSTPPDGNPRLTWVQTDLADHAALARMCDTYRPSHLLALAWEMGPGYQQSVENYRWIQHSIELIFAFAAAGGQRVTFCGSCMEYDWTLETPFVEEHSPLRPDTDYGQAKAALSQAFPALLTRLELSGAWARPYFLYGPGENPRRLAADVILSLLDNREALCGAGTQKRDFLHVGDVASAMTKLLFSDLEGAVNIGSGAAIPMAELITEIGRQIDRPELIKLGARAPRPGDPDLVEADITRLRDKLGWQPSFTLESGIADTIGWWHSVLERDKG